MHTQTACGNVVSKSKGVNRNKKIDIHFRIPEKKVEEIKLFVISQGGTVETCGTEDLSIPWQKAFPDAHPGMALHGLRVREGLTQKELAAKIGVEQSHISAMENGKRLIGKALAKKIVEIFGGDYRVFL